MDNVAVGLFIAAIAGVFHSAFNKNYSIRAGGNLYHWEFHFEATKPKSRKARNGSTNGVQAS